MGTDIAKAALDAGHKVIATGRNIERDHRTVTSRLSPRVDRRPAQARRAVDVDLPTGHCLLMDEFRPTR